MVPLGGTSGMTINSWMGWTLSAIYAIGHMYIYVPSFPSSLLDSIEGSLQVTTQFLPTYVCVHTRVTWYTVYSSFSSIRCVSLCVGACVRACVRVCVRVCEREINIRQLTCNLISIMHELFDLARC